MEESRNRVSLLRLAPEIWKYQTFTKLALALIFAAIRLSALFLLHSAGRVAVSSGDYRFLFHTWQGPLIIALFLASGFLCVSVDLNVKILYAGNVMDGVTEPVLSTVKRAFLALPKFLNIHGVGVVLYVTLVAPVVGTGLGVSLTENLKIPNFISSVIEATPLYNVLYTLLSLLFAAVGISHIFCLHGVLLDGLSVREARRRSNALMRKRWRNYWAQNILYSLRMLGWIALSLSLLFLLPLAVAGHFLRNSANETLLRFAAILILFLGAALFGLASLLATPYYILRITKLYREYSAGKSVSVPERAVGRFRFSVALSVAAILGSVGLSALAAQNFDAFFPLHTVTQVVAHRGGGNEGTENTVSGLEAAVSLGAYGSEIDIQRTLDGHYIVNHDATFQRIAGDSRTPGEMTLEETKRLRVQGSGDSVATLEEMLDAAKGRILLFVELKGASADREMCDDAVRIIRERDMVDGTVLISLKYELIDYIETHYPEIQTGYLTFLSYGDTVRLRCDYLGLEEESVTASAIDAVHAQGKKLLVWTPNEPESQERFLSMKADAIITDNVAQANDILERLNRRNDFERILSAFRQ